MASCRNIIRRKCTRPADERAIAAYIMSGGRTVREGYYSTKIRRTQQTRDAIEVPPSARHDEIRASRGI